MCTFSPSLSFLPCKMEITPAYPLSKYCSRTQDYPVASETLSTLPGRASMWSQETRFWGRDDKRLV